LVVQKIYPVTVGLASDLAKQPNFSLAYITQDMPFNTRPTAITIWKPSAALTSRSMPATGCSTPRCVRTYWSRRPFHRKTGRTLAS
jgi:hypothetical protein